MAAGKERFHSRLGMMLTMLGMAVGTGNIWRFPRIAAANGGGEFLVAWLAFLFLWSIPLLLTELALGRKTRGGPVRAVVETMGPRWGWLGAFVALVTTLISFYYSVVAGWTLTYAGATLVGTLPEAVPGELWRSLTSSAWPLLGHGVMFGLAALVVARGVGAIECVALVMMPTLLVLVAALTLRALSLDGASEGLSFLFSVDWSALGRPTLWLEALTQNAWDTGAGWGLALCYAAYLREREDTALNAFLLPTANNAISLVAGVMVFCTVFSVLPRLVASSADPAALAALSPALAEAVAGGAPVSAELLQQTIFSSGNTGITFIWMPQLFAGIPGGRFFMFLFFAALAFAAFTSLLAMLELTTRTLVDAGWTRGRAIRVVAAVGFFGGAPSALSMKLLDNQDWVWSVALMLSGLILAMAVVRYGPAKLRREHLNHEFSDIKIGRWWDPLIAALVPLQAVVLVVWFLYGAWQADPEGWLRPFNSDNVFNVGTVLVQVGIALLLLRLANKRITTHLQKRSTE